MLYFIYFLLLFSLLTNIQGVTGNTTFSYQKTSIYQDRSTATLLNVSMTQTAMGPYNSSTAIKLVSKVNADTRSSGNASSTLPAPFVNDDIWQKSTEMRNYQNIKAGFCAMDDDFCSFDGLSPSMNVSSTAEFEDVCLLWDKSCTGNRTLAIKNFFRPAKTTLASQFGLNTTAYNFDVLLNSCFRGTGLTDPSDCAKYNPPSRLEEWDKIRSWMRSDQCVSTQNEYEKMIRQPAINSTAEDSPSCCDVCGIASPNADIYYWPEGNLDTSCLSIIGPDLHPLGYGGTTTTNLGSNGNSTYWACSNPHPTTSILSELGLTFVNSIITTAVVTNVGSLTIKIPVQNPWSASPCGEDVEADQDSNKTTLSNASMSPPGKYPNIHARTHLPLIPASITQQNGLPVSTVVVENFTL